jgi:hypothetical protein
MAWSARAALAAALLWWCPARAYAQDPAEGYDREEARQHGEEGLALYDKGDYAGALAKLEKASAFVEAPTLKLYEARCLVKLSRLVEAEARFVTVTAMPLPAKPSELFTQAQDDARRERAELLPRIPTLEIRLLGSGASDANVRIDGKLVDASTPGTRHRVDPGKRHVQARLGDRVRETTVEVSEGENRALTIDLSPGPSKQPASQEDAPLNPIAVAGIAVMGVGAAGVLVWAGTGIAAMFRAGDLGCVDAICPASEDDVAELTRLRTASTVSFWIGAPALAAGAVLLAVSFSLEAQEPSTGARLRATVGPGSFGIEGAW